VDTRSTSWLIEIDDHFLQSAVSYYDLNRKVPHYSHAVEVVKIGSYNITGFTQEQIEILRNVTRKLYGLLHQRFAITDDGVRKLARKVSVGLYGLCPRIACKGAKLIPMGFSLEPELDTVKVWCPKCHDVYNGKSNLDGAYFGPDLPMMYLKITGASLRFQVYSKFLEGYEDGSEHIPRIKQRLVRWGEMDFDTEMS
jgi:casein kinase II subunit beta